jgi:hypothetical protein
MIGTVISTLWRFWVGKWDSSRTLPNIANQLITSDQLSAKLV